MHNKLPCRLLSCRREILSPPRLRSHPSRSPAGAGQLPRQHRPPGCESARGDGPRSSFSTHVGLARSLPRARLVRGREVRHLPPLGRLLRSGIRKRVVLAQHVRPGQRRLSPITSPPTARSRSSATRTSSPSSKPQHFDPAAWVDLFTQAGARYVVPVAEHCDGFAMYASDVTPWNAAHMGPHRDIVGELERATRARGLHFGVSSHTAEHWWWYGRGRTISLRRPRGHGSRREPAT